MVHFLIKNIFLSVVIFTCVNHCTTFAQEIQDWCAHVTHIKKNQFRFTNASDIENRGIFYRTKVYPNLVLRINDNGYVNLFTFYKLYYPNDSTLELKSIGYDDIDVVIRENKSLSEQSVARWRVFLNIIEIPGYINLKDTIFSEKKPSSNRNMKHYRNIDYPLFTYTVRDVEGVAELKIPSLGNYRINIPELYFDKSIDILISTPTSIVSKLNRIVYHSKLIFKLKYRDEFIHEPREVLSRNFFDNDEFFYTKKSFFEYLHEGKKIIKHIELLSALSDENESLLNLDNMLSYSAFKNISFETVKNRKYKKSAMHRYIKYKKANGLKKS